MKGNSAVHYVTDPNVRGDSVIHCVADPHVRWNCVIHCVAEPHIRENSVIHCMANPQVKETGNVAQTAKGNRGTTQAEALRHIQSFNSCNPIDESLARTQNRA